MKKVLLLFALIPLLASGGQLVNTGSHRKLFTHAGATACGTSVTGVLADYWAGSNSSSPVPTWSDSSTNANTLSATGSPTWANNTFGTGLAGVTGSGSGQYYSESALIPAASFANLSMYVVFKYNATGAYFTSNHNCSTGVNCSFTLQINGSNHLELDKQNVIALCTSATTLSTGTTYEAYWDYNGSTCHIYLNGTLDTTNTITQAFATGIDRFMTGFDSTPFPFNGSIYEAIFSSSTSYQSGAHTCWTALGLP